MFDKHFSTKSDSHQHQLSEQAPPLRCGFLTVMRRIDDRWTERMLEWILKEAANEDPWEYNLFWTPKHYHREKKFKDQLEIKTEIVGFFDLQRPMKAVGSLDTWYKPDGMLLRYLCVPLTARQETRMRDRPAISMENYTIYCGDADENKVGGCVIAVEERLQESGGEIWLNVA
ncbi:hypothetical protein RB195_024001 [Necator americanus]|uniref:Uncharacterized protein n=1 Tax=Necator americanus TaxID=51031 RepID=A0ABR1ELM6_NECAM